jgi:RNA polymerase sigma-70 factor (ECF subfamily)
MKVIHTDRALARQILAGDEAAFKDLFERFFPRLFRFALARLGGNQDAAREVVQQTFCKAIERLDSYRGEAALYSWFCQICRNNIADLGRQRAREANQTTLLEEDGEIRAILDTVAAPPADEPERRLQRTQIVRLVQATLDSLPGRYGDVLEWKYVDGLTVKEIAVRLAIGPKAAESTLTRARQAFRDAVVAIGAADAFQQVMGNAPLAAAGDTETST